MDKQVLSNLFGACQLCVLTPGLSPHSKGIDWVISLFLTCCTSSFGGFLLQQLLKMVLDSCWKLSYKEYLLLPLGGNFVLFMPRYK